MALKITRLRDLYFPNGNEKGETWEPYYKAEVDGKSAHGASAEAARDNLIKQLESENHGTENQTC